jgi:hypothetical protein
MLYEETNISVNTACEVLSLPRSSYYYQAKEKDDGELKAAITLIPVRNTSAQEETFRAFCHRSARKPGQSRRSNNSTPTRKVRARPRAR